MSSSGERPNQDSSIRIPNIAEYTQSQSLELVANLSSSGQGTTEATDTSKIVFTTATPGPIFFRLTMSAGGYKKQSIRILNDSFVVSLNDLVRANVKDRYEMRVLARLHQWEYRSSSKEYQKVTGSVYR